MAKITLLVILTRGLQMHIRIILKPYYCFSVRMLLVAYTVIQMYVHTTGAQLNGPGIFDGLRDQFQCNSSSQVIRIIAIQILINLPDPRGGGGGGDYQFRTCVQTLTIFVQPINYRTKLQSSPYMQLESIDYAYLSAHRISSGRTNKIVISVNQFIKYITL